MTWTSIIPHAAPPCPRGLESPGSRWGGWSRSGPSRCTRTGSSTHRTSATSPWPVPARSATGCPGAPLQVMDQIEYTADRMNPRMRGCTG